MNAVATAVQPVSVELKATSKYRRRLLVERSARDNYWVGLLPPSRLKAGQCSLGYAGVYDPKQVHVTEWKDGDVSLCVGDASFGITRAEADRLVAAFGFEVKRL